MCRSYHWSRTVGLIVISGYIPHILFESKESFFLTFFNLSILSLPQLQIKHSIAAVELTQIKEKVSLSWYESLFVSSLRVFIKSSHSFFSATGWGGICLVEMGLLTALSQASFQH